MRRSVQEKCENMRKKGSESHAFLGDRVGSPCFVASLYLTCMSRYVRMCMCVCGYAYPVCGLCDSRARACTLYLTYSHVQPLPLYTRRRPHAKARAISSRDTPSPTVDTRVNATSIVRRVRCRRSVLQPGACFH